MPFSEIDGLDGTLVKDIFFLLFLPFSTFYLRKYFSNIDASRRRLAPEFIWTPRNSKYPTYAPVRSRKVSCE